ncbi:hypothetical protein ACFQU9_29745 [Actinomadura namibiensis]|uniref:Putative Zn finger protein n=1 Tax=Actinomadura namibiensis TaxID=182080 RepID=A0A7W3LJI5_ACTNM|nr:hypothetical protein [Actinomadura namibiensis]MBA8949187.1 putative Zn finger protein [Actinomadura namibiensis]
MSWSERFLAAVEALADPVRMARGRVFAEAERVDRLKVAPHEVTARVAGLGGEAFDVALGVDAIDPADWRRVEAALAAHPVLRARLLSGELPPEVADVFAEAGTSLFPAALHMMCGCDDWGTPCDHGAAVLYALARAFDEDPFLVLAWNGRTREDLLTALRRAPAAAEEDTPDEPLTAEGFWARPSGLARLRERRPAPPVPPGFVLQVAAPPPVRVRRRDLADALLPAYEALASAAPERE